MRAGARELLFRHLKLGMNLRKIFAAQLAACVVCSNASYVFGNLNLLVPAVQAILLCATTFVIVHFIGKDASIAVGSAVWVGLLSSASFLPSLSMCPSRVSFDAGIYDRGPFFLGSFVHRFACCSGIYFPGNHMNMRLAIRASYRERFER